MMGRIDAGQKAVIIFQMGALHCSKKSFFVLQCNITVVLAAENFNSRGGALLA